jgi:Protein of unknown function (DUF2442)
MTTSPIETQPQWAQAVRIEADLLVVDLLDGRVLSVPLAWFPRLLAGTEQERENCRFVGRGEGISWPDLDEDISVASLLAGQASAESQASLKRWLATRAGQPPHEA